MDPAPQSPASARPGRPTGLVAIVVGASGLFMLSAGVAALGWPHAFADFVEFDRHEHFVHDAGAFQAGIGIGLLLALLWRDAITVVLAAFLVANTLHAYNHATDLDLGGRGTHPWLLDAVSVVVAVALALRLRDAGNVVGYVRPASVAELAPFVSQKTVALTTFRRDGTPVSTPVSLAVNGDRAVFRSAEKTGKVGRLRHDERTSVAPATLSGKPTGPSLPGRARRLEGAAEVDARRLLRSKHPGLHGVVVPLVHHLRRRKFGATLHFEFIPTPMSDVAASTAGGRSGR
jgi:PPOX class probable F420-dependent enzyme